MVGKRTCWAVNSNGEKREVLCGGGDGEGGNGMGGRGDGGKGEGGGSMSRTCWAAVKTEPEIYQNVFFDICSVRKY